MNKLIVAALLTSAAIAVQPAQAALPVCSASDISPTASPFTTFGSFDCSGFVEGQAFAGSAQSKDILQTLLDGLYGAGVKDADDYTGTKLSGLSGAMSYDFSSAPFNTTLNGMTLIGMHFGGGQGSPGQVGGLQGHDTSVLYLFDAGTNLSDLYWKYNASSDIVLYTTGSSPAVPEPATWALMIAGFGLAGTVLRGRKTKVQFA